MDFSKSNAQLSIVRILFHHILDHKKHGNQAAIKCVGTYLMTHDFKLCHLCSSTLYFCDEQQMWQTHIDFWLFFPCCERIFLQKAMFLYHCGQKWQNRIINGKCVSLVKTSSNFLPFFIISHLADLSIDSSCLFEFKRNKRRQFGKMSFLSEISKTTVQCSFSIHASR